MAAYDLDNIRQLKWLYGALTGVCTVFFLTLFGTGADIKNSCLLFISSICFSICLPLFAGFTIAHMTILDLEIPKERYEPFLQGKHIIYLTRFAVIAFATGFVLMIGSISWILIPIVLVAAVFTLLELKNFYNNITKAPP